MTDLKRVEINLLGESRSLVFPPGHFMNLDIEKVLGGTEYPMHVIQDFEPQIIVDIGASIGMSALYFHHAYPNATINAFEPGRLSFECLHQNVAGLPKIRIHDFGLLDRDEELPLYHSEDGPTASSLSNNNKNDGAHETIRVRRAAHVFEELGFERISILKIDTEGAEPRILADLADWLPRTDVLLLELHSDRARGMVEKILDNRFVLRAADIPTVHRATLMYVSISALNEERLHTVIAPALEI